MDSTGILVVIGTVGVNEIKLHRSMEGTEKVALLGLIFKEMVNLQRSQRWKVEAVCQVGGTKSAKVWRVWRCKQVCCVFCDVMRNLVLTVRRVTLSSGHIRASVDK